MFRAAPVVLACASLVCASLSSVPAYACKPQIAYDFALPTDTGCVGVDAEEIQSGSPEIDLTNNCASAVTATAGASCRECDASLTVQPGRSAAYVVHHSVGENERADFEVSWLAADGESGSFSGTVRRKEGYQDPCDDSACSTILTHRASWTGSLWALALVALVRRRRRS